MTVPCKDHAGCRSGDSPGAAEIPHEVPLLVPGVQACQVRRQGLSCRPASHLLPDAWAPKVVGAVFEDLSEKGAGT